MLKFPLVVRAVVNDALLAFVLFLALVAAYSSARAESPLEFNLAEFSRTHDGARLHSREHRSRAGAPVAGGRVQHLLAAAAARNHVPLRVARAIMTIESRGDCRARSHSNARGAMQVLPATARSVGVHGNLYDCAVGIEAGMRYLRLVISTHGLSCGALSAYERGVFARPRCTAYGRRAVRLASLGE